MSKRANGLLASGRAQMSCYGPPPVAAEEEEVIMTDAAWLKLKRRLNPQALKLLARAVYTDEDTYANGERLSAAALQRIKDAGMGWVTLFLVQGAGAEADARFNKWVEEHCKLHDISFDVFMETYCANTSGQRDATGVSSRATFHSLDVYTNTAEDGDGTTHKLSECGGRLFVDGVASESPITSTHWQALLTQLDTGKTANGKHVGEQPAAFAYFSLVVALLTFAWPAVVKLLLSCDETGGEEVLQAFDPKTGERIALSVDVLGQGGAWSVRLFKDGCGPVGATLRVGFASLSFKVLTEGQLICLLMLLMALLFSIFEAHNQLTESPIVLTRFGDIELRGQAGGKARAAAAEIEAEQAASELRDRLNAIEDLETLTALQEAMMLRGGSDDQLAAIMETFSLSSS